MPSSLLLFSQSVGSNCDLMNCSTPGFPVLHHLLELAQIHVHWVGDAILTISSSVGPFSSCPQTFPGTRAFLISRFSHQVAKLLAFQLQHQPFQWIFRVYFLWDWLVWSCCCPRDSQESSQTPKYHNMKSCWRWQHDSISMWE